MAGLSSANFVGGLMQGANFVAGMQDRQAQREERATLGTLRQSGERRAQESHDLQMAAAPDEMAARKSRAQAEQMDLENKINAENARMMFHAKENGLAVPAYLPGQKEFFDKVGPTASAAYILDPRTQKAVQSAHGVMDGSVPLNSPDSHEALQTLIPDIQSGTKADGTVRVNGIYPSKDGSGLHIGLHVTKNDGTEDPHGVVTQNRTSDPKDPVRTVGTDGILQRAALLHQWQQNLSDPRYAQAYMDTYYPPAERLKDKEAQQRVNINDLQAKKINKDLNEGDPVTYQVDGSGNLMQLPTRSGSAAATPVVDPKGNPVKAPQKAGAAGAQGTQRQKDYEFAIDRLRMDENAALEWASSHKSMDERAADYANRMVYAETKDQPPEGYSAPDKWRSHRDLFMKEYGNFGKVGKQPKPDPAQAKQPQPFKNGAGPIKAPTQNDQATQEQIKAALDQIKAANPGKSDEWHKAYLNHLAGQQRHG